MDYKERFEELFSYWWEIRGDDPLPSRQEFCPAHVVNVVSRLLILERVNEDSFLIRLSGSDLDEHFGHSVKDMDIREVLMPKGHWSGRDNDKASHDPLPRVLSLLLSRPMGVAGRRVWHSTEGDFPCYFTFLPFCVHTSGCHKIVGQMDFEPHLNILGLRRMTGWGEIEELRPIDLGFGVDAQFADLPTLEFNPSAA